MQHTCRLAHSTASLSQPRPACRCSPRAARTLHTHLARSTAFPAHQRSPRLPHTAEGTRRARTARPSPRIPQFQRIPRTRRARTRLRHNPGRSCSGTVCPRQPRATACCRTRRAISPATQSLREPLQQRAQATKPRRAALPGFTGTRRPAQFLKRAPGQLSAWPSCSQTRSCARGAAVELYPRTHGVSPNIVRATRAPHAPRRRARGSCLSGWMSTLP